LASPAGELTAEPVPLKVNSPPLMTREKPYAAGVSELAVTGWKSLSDREGACPGMVTPAQLTRVEVACPGWKG
jgi:hypothetical protein